jgi:hypothetical protein
LPVTTVTVTGEPVLLALTSTPSIALLSVELTRPVRAVANVCANETPGTSIANNKLTATTRARQHMISSRASQFLFVARIGPTAVIQQPFLERAKGS